MYYMDNIWTHITVTKNSLSIL